MQEAKKLKIMAGAMQDAIEVLNHVWEQMEEPMDILNSFSYLREITQWGEYNVRVIPFLLNLTNTEPHPETQKYIGRNCGKKAQLYANSFAMCLSAHFTSSAMDELFSDEEDEDKEFDLEDEG